MRNAASVDFYLDARASIYAGAWAPEVAAVKQLSAASIGEQHFLCEAAWVILNAGFRESVVRERFSYLSLCFHDWESAAAISRDAERCVRTARAAFANDRKLSAIASCSAIVATNGFEVFWQGVSRDPITALQQLPHIGPVTVWHLAKNLGFKVAKPDRHLERLARHFGYRDAHELCDVLAEQTGDTPDVVDSILWRYLATISETSRKRAKPPALKQL